MPLPSTSTLPFDVSPGFAGMVCASAEPASRRIAMAVAGAKTVVMVSPLVSCIAVGAPHSTRHWQENMAGCLSPPKSGTFAVRKPLDIHGKPPPDHKPEGAAGGGSGVHAVPAL